MSALLEFSCYKPIGGYRLISFDQRKLARVTKADGAEAGEYSVVPPQDATDDERYVLTQWGDVRVSPHPGERAGIIRVLVPQSERIERFDLFQAAPALFLEFAHLPCTAGAVKSFADRFGNLTGERPEWISTWYLAIRQMRRAVAVWEQAKATANFARIARLIDRRVSHRFFAVEPLDRGIGANVFLRTSPEGPPSLGIQAGELVDALWIQLALAVAGNQNLRACAECQTWFPVEAGGSRSDKEYCSDACRMRAYRRRKSSTVSRSVARKKS